MMHALRYAFEEATASLWRGRQSGLLSTATIAVALFVLGGFLLVTSNLERLSAAWSQAAELSVYLSDSVTAEERAAIERMLAPGDVIAEVRYLSKADAAVRFGEIFPDLAGALDPGAENPLPASYEARLDDPVAAGRVEDLARLLREAPGVVDVRFDREWLERLVAAVSIVQGFGLALGTMLTLAAALTVANVVRLALYARRAEIQIMDLVGAPAVYVRGPFVMEGILQGGLGALVALAALAATFLAMRGRYLTPLVEAVNLPAARFLPLELCGILLVGGTFVGCVGGLVATSGRR
jgi:cell division transport system permease protein